jgi:hypothetical protein
LDVEILVVNDQNHLVWIFLGIFEFCSLNGLILETLALNVFEFSLLIFVFKLEGDCEN